VCTDTCLTQSGRISVRRSAYTFDNFQAREPAKIPPWKPDNCTAIKNSASAKCCQKSNQLSPVEAGKSHILMRLGFFRKGTISGAEGIYMLVRRLKCTGADVDSINFSGHITCRINLHTHLGKANSNYHLEMICDRFFVCFLCALAPIGF
jgi:hypothetical protein